MTTVLDAAYNSDQFIDASHQNRVLNFEELNMKIDSGHRDMNHHMYLQILTSSIYQKQLKNWLKYFDQEQFIFINGDQLKSDPFPVLDKFQERLGIQKQLVEKNFCKNPETGFYCYCNLAGKRSYMDTAIKGRTLNNKMSEMAETKLNEFFSKFNNGLFELIGEKYDW